MKLVVLGPPGAGKGTQAIMLAERLHIVHIATGDMLREQIALKTELGTRISRTINAGQFVPNELVFELVKKRLKDSDAKGGFVLDGFPRTIEQALMMDVTDGLSDIELVCSLAVPDSVIIERMSGRLTCSQCGAMFHLVYSPPQAAGICDDCGAGLYQRPDDKAETVVERLKLYHARTEPIINFYTGRGLLVTVDAAGDIATVSERTIRAVTDKGAR
ncbi:MAG: adenylate kinase [Clostridiales bacterium]|jgi:adenylate kinase|nr:adenylate kinase [Clostridiales bacterium]